jgi:hypothetical protein
VGLSSPDCKLPVLLNFLTGLRRTFSMGPLRAYDPRKFEADIRDFLEQGWRIEK